MKIELHDPSDTAKVISIEIARQRHLMLKEAECKHTAVRVDRLEAKLTCRTCGKEVNPVEWIAMMGEHWRYVEDLMRRYKSAQASYEAKQRCRCDHCGKITKVRPATAAEVREFQRGTKQDEGKNL